MKFIYLIKFHLLLRLDRARYSIYISIYDTAAMTKKQKRNLWQWTCRLFAAVDSWVRIFKQKQHIDCLDILAFVPSYIRHLREKKKRGTTMYKWEISLTENGEAVKVTIPICSIWCVGTFSRSNSPFTKCLLFVLIRPCTTLRLIRNWFSYKQVRYCLLFIADFTQREAIQERLWNANFDAWNNQNYIVVYTLHQLCSSKTCVSGAWFGNVASHQIIIF